MPILKKAITIDDKPVGKCNFSIGQYEVYRHQNVDSDDTLYFVDMFGNVVGQIELVCDMSQGCGYISEVNGVNHQ